MSNGRSNADSASFNFLQFTVKLLLALFTVYTGIAFGYAAFSPYSYTRRRQNFLHSLSGIMLQPVMTVFAGGKVTQAYDWENISAEALDTTTPEAMVYGSKRTTGEPISEFWQNLGNSAQEVAVIEPVDYPQKWSLIRCYRQEDQTRICQRSNLLHLGAVKMHTAGSPEIWGQDMQGNYIPLRVRGYILEGQRSDLLLL